MNKKLVSMWNAGQIAASNNNIASALREQTRSAEELSEKEIKSKDRVDITLEEYESMKERIKELEADNRYYKQVCSQFNIPDNIRINPETMTLDSFYNPESMTTDYMIRFRAENWRIN